MASYSRINSSTLSFSGDTLTNKNTGIYVGVLNQKTHIYEGEYNNAEKTITYSEDNTTYTTNKPNWLELKLSDTIDNNTASELLITLNGNTNAERTCYIKLSQNSADYLKIVQNYTKGIKIWNLTPEKITSNTLKNKGILISFLNNNDSLQQSATFSLIKFEDNSEIECNNYIVLPLVDDDEYEMVQTEDVSTLFTNNFDNKILEKQVYNFNIEWLKAYTNDESITAIKNKNLNFITKGFDNSAFANELDDYINKLYYYITFVSLDNINKKVTNIYSHGNGVFDMELADSLLPSGSTYDNNQFIKYNFNYNTSTYKWENNKSILNLSNIGIFPSYSADSSISDKYRYINIIFSQNTLQQKLLNSGMRDLYFVCFHNMGNNITVAKIFKNVQTLPTNINDNIQVCFEAQKIIDTDLDHGDNVNLIHGDDWPDFYSISVSNKINDISVFNIYKDLYKLQDIQNLTIQNPYKYSINNEGYSQQEEWRYCLYSIQQLGLTKCDIIDTSIYIVGEDKLPLIYNRGHDHNITITDSSLNNLIQTSYIKIQFGSTGAWPISQLLSTVLNSGGDYSETYNSNNLEYQMVGNKYEGNILIWQ